MDDDIIVMTRECPRCEEFGEIVMSAADAEHGKTLRWAGSPIEECFPTLSPAEQQQIKTGIHPQCKGATQ